MGIGPIPAVEKLCARLGLKPSDFDAVELNEAFASQALACLRGLGLPDDADHVNPNGGAIALGHPLGMSGARIAGSVALQLARTAAGSASRRCASASARGWRWRSSGSADGLPLRDGFGGWPILPHCTMAGPRGIVYR